MSKKHHRHENYDEYSLLNSDFASDFDVGFEESEDSLVS